MAEPIHSQADNVLMGAIVGFCMQASRHSHRDRVDIKLRIYVKNA